MRRIVAVFLISLCVFVMIGCSSSGNENMSKERHEDELKDLNLPEISYDIPQKVFDECEEDAVMDLSSEELRVALDYLAYSKNASMQGYTRTVGEDEVTEIDLNMKMAKNAIYLHMDITTYDLSMQFLDEEESELYFSLDDEGKVLDAAINEGDGYKRTRIFDGMVLAPSDFLGGGDSGETTDLTNLIYLQNEKNYHKLSDHRYVILAKDFNEAIEKELSKDEMIDDIRVASDYLIAINEQTITTSYILEMVIDGETYTTDYFVAYYNIDHTKIEAPTITYSSYEDLYADLNLAGFEDPFYSMRDSLTWHLLSDKTDTIAVYENADLEELLAEHPGVEYYVLGNFYLTSSNEEKLLTIFPECQKVDTDK